MIIYILNYARLKLEKEYYESKFKQDHTFHAKKNHIWIFFFSYTLTTIYKKKMNNVNNNNVASISERESMDGATMQV